MHTWQLNDIPTPGGRTSPVVLFSDDARAVLIGLEPGQRLGDHEVRERAWLTVLDGSVTVEADGTRMEAGAGTLLTFEPGERHSVHSSSGARLLLLLTSWPGPGHYPGVTVEPTAPE